MGRRIICIGREFGSGGHEIAVRLGQTLGLKVYEKNLLHMACKYGDLAVKRLESSDEKATNPYLYETVHEGNYHVARGLPTSEVLFHLQSHEIKRIASEEDCIFVGRCADHVLREEKVSLLSAFVTAPLEQRIQRKMEQESLSHWKASHLVQKMDHQRRRYYEHYTGKAWGEAESYDMMIDRGAVSLDEAVELLATRFRAMSSPAE